MLHPCRGLREKLFQTVFSAPTKYLDCGERIAMPNEKNKVNAKHQALAISMSRAYVSQNMTIRIYFPL